MRLLVKILSVLFVVAVPILLVTTNVRVLVNTPALYSFGFDQFDIPVTTGLAREELISVGEQIRDYFNNDEVFIYPEARFQDGVRRVLFNNREILHMFDVKQVLRNVYWAQLGSAVYLALFLVFGIVLAPEGLARRMLRLMFRGGLATLALIGITVVASLIGFDRVFYWFHIISFTNDLWQLDPTRDYLIAMFPQGFFFLATMIIGVATLLEAGGLTFVTWFTGRKLFRRPAKEDIMAKTELVVAKKRRKRGRKEEPVWATNPAIMPTVEDRAEVSGRKLRSEEIAEWVMAGYYVAEGIFLAVAPTISMLRGKKKVAKPTTDH